MTNKKATSDEKRISPPAEFKFTPRRVALVAVDWDQATKKTTKRTVWDEGFDPFFTGIAKIADEEKCDTIVYALWSHDIRSMPKLTESRLFGSTSRLKTCVLETSDSEGKSFIEVWNRGHEPHRFQQQFVKSSDSVGEKRAFIEDLPARTLGHVLVMACGETNIISTKRDSVEVVDRFGFRKYLDDSEIKIVLNPIHDFMMRREMKSKRAVYSKNGRCVLSVWNKGNKSREAAVPWTAFVNGKEATETIREVPFPQAADIRIGLFDVPK